MLCSVIASSSGRSAVPSAPTTELAVSCSFPRCDPHIPRAMRRKQNVISNRAVTLREEHKFRASVVPQFDTEWCLAPGNGGHHGSNDNTRYITTQGRSREGSVRRGSLQSRRRE